MWTIENKDVLVVSICLYLDACEMYTSIVLTSYGHESKYTTANDQQC